MALYRAAVALLYPGRNIRCFLIYTSGPRVEEIDAARLDTALAEALTKASGRSTT
jgi:ATP-dependent helicase/nuclease subunit A